MQAGRILKHAAIAAVLALGIAVGGQSASADGYKVIYIAPQLNNAADIVIARNWQDVSESLGLGSLSPTAQVGYLSGGQKKAVAISRALYWDARLIFMDEPTAALAVVEIGKVLELIGRLRETGVAVVFVSHNLQEIFSTADRIMVLHRGQLAGIRQTGETDQDEIIKLMMGVR